MIYSDADLAKILLMGNSMENALAQYYLAQEILASADLEYMQNRYDLYLRFLAQMNGVVDLRNLPAYYVLANRDLNIQVGFDDYVCSLGTVGSWLVQYGKRLFMTGFVIGVCGAFLNAAFFGFVLGFVLFSCFILGSILCSFFLGSILWFWHKHKFGWQFRYIIVDSKVYLIHCIPIVSEERKKLELYSAVMSGMPECQGFDVAYIDRFKLIAVRLYCLFEHKWLMDSIVAGM